MIVVAHLHNNGLRYSVNTDGRCGWYTCTHNVYNSFDEPESVITEDDATGEGEERGSATR